MMNVIFLDFDGVLNTYHYDSDEEIERTIKILSEICHKLDCSVVIEASAKDAIDEETLEVYNDRIQFIFDCFKKYDIKCVGRTPNVIIKTSDCTCIPIWKEEEIRLYLFKHPEIDHYCVIDDDDLGPKHSDLDKVRPHLVKTIDYTKHNKEDEGLLIEHLENVKKALELENEVQRFALRRKK